MYFIFLYYPGSKVARAQRSCHGSLRASLGAAYFGEPISRAAEAKNAATINHLMSKRQSVLSFIIQGQRSQGLAGLAAAPFEHRDGQLTSESPFRIVESG